MIRRPSSPAAAGIIAGLIAFAVNAATVIVPAIAAHTADSRTSLSLLDAIMVALSFFALGNGGAIHLTVTGMTGPVTISPVGLTVVFFAVLAFTMRSRARLIEFTRADGGLHPGAIAGLGVIIGAFAAAYTVATMVTMMLITSADVRVTTIPTTLAALVLSLVAGAVGTMASLKRPADGGIPAVGMLALIPHPFDAIIRAIGATVLLLLGLGALLTTVMLAVASPSVMEMFTGLKPGPFGGAVLILAQLLVLPSLIVWAMVVLLGGTVLTGIGTGISLGGATVGVLPVLPVLAALPQPGVFPRWMLALMILPVIAVGMGAVLLARETRPLADEPPLDGREIAVIWGGFVGGLFCVLMLLAAFSGGAIGADQLSELGPKLSSLALPLLGIIVLGAGSVAVWELMGLGQRTADATQRLRDRVDASERTDED